MQAANCLSKTLEQRISNALKNELNEIIENVKAKAFDEISARIDREVARIGIDLSQWVDITQDARTLVITIKKDKLNAN